MHARLLNKLYIVGVICGQIVEKRGFFVKAKQDDVCVRESSISVNSEIFNPMAVRHLVVSFATMSTT